MKLFLVLGALITGCLAQAELDCSKVEVTWQGSQPVVTGAPEVLENAFARSVCLVQKGCSTDAELTSDQRQQCDEAKTAAESHEQYAKGVWGSTDQGEVGSKYSGN